MHTVYKFINTVGYSKFYILKIKVELTNQVFNIYIFTIMLYIYFTIYLIQYYVNMLYTFDIIYIILEISLQNDTSVCPRIVWPFFGCCRTIGWPSSCPQTHWHLTSPTTRIYRHRRRSSRPLFIKVHIRKFRNQWRAHDDILLNE